MAGSGTAHLRPGSPLLLVDDVEVEYTTGHGRKVQAVSGVSIDVMPGETLGLVGESGCGKSSLARAVVQMPQPTGGRVIFEGHDLGGIPRDELRRLRPKVQLIHQDPISSLNPRRTVGRTIEEPLRIWRQGDASLRSEVVGRVLEAVGLDPTSSRRLPHELSGGQCQRVSIARALVLNPSLLICDEPVSALDVSVQAQILNLLEDTKAKFGLTLLFISHDLAVIKHASDRIAVMYLGKLCEVGAPDQIYRSPAHPYTASLLASMPKTATHIRDAGAVVVGEPPSPLNPPSGCRYRTWCPRAQERCAAEEPLTRPWGAGGDRFVACHFPIHEPAHPGIPDDQASTSIDPPTARDLGDSA
jgi:peptide/nickel transport system ATP-binding protein